MLEHIPDYFFMMQICWKIDVKFLVLVAILSSVKCQPDRDESNERAERLAEMLKHDGIERVVELTQKNMKSLLKKYNIMVVLYHTQTNDTMLRQEKYALEVFLVNFLLHCIAIFSQLCGAAVGRNLEHLQKIFFLYLGLLNYRFHMKIDFYKNSSEINHLCIENNA